MREGIEEDMERILDNGKKFKLNWYGQNEINGSIWQEPPASV